MGISGLLPLLRSIQRQRHLRDFASKTLGVDGYAWLHRGVNGCATELVQGLPCRQHVNYFIHRVRMLIHFGVIPFVVFDGDNLPSKAGTEAARAARRQEEAAKGLRLLNAGRRAEAAAAMQKAVDVTPVMAREVIEELKKLNVQYVVAPYEADAQLVYLERLGMIDGVLADDSDMLVFGCKSLVTKLEKNGECTVINREDFGSCSEVSIAGWTDDEFRTMCILSGCDYLTSPGGIGLKTAHSLVRRYKNIERIVKAVLLDSKYKMPPNYLQSFHKAERTFLHQRVFCPKQKKLVMFTETGEELSDEVLAVIGDDIPAEIAVEIANGNLHPSTREQISLARKPAQRQSWPLKQAVRQIPTETPKSNSIGNFFKPKRTPLAELNVNSLTPVSNPRLLQSAPSASWPAVLPPIETPVPARPVANPAIYPTPVTGRTTTQSTELNLSSSKKRRLCSEVDSDTSGFLVSPFFSQNVSTSTSAKKAKTVEIWSDATFAETAPAAAAENSHIAAAEVDAKEILLPADPVSLNISDPKELTTKPLPKSRIPVPVAKAASSVSKFGEGTISRFALGSVTPTTNSVPASKLPKGQTRSITASAKQPPTLQRKSSSFRQLPTPSLSRETSTSTVDASQRLREGSISRKTTFTKSTSSISSSFGRRQSSTLGVGTVVKEAKIRTSAPVSAPVICGSEDLLDYVDESREDSETLASFRRFMYKG